MKKLGEMLIKNLKEICKSTKNFGSKQTVKLTNIKAK